MFKHKNKSKSTTREPQINLDSMNQIANDAQAPATNDVAPVDSVDPMAQMDAAPVDPSDIPTVPAVPTTADAQGISPEEAADAIYGMNVDTAEVVPTELPVTDELDTAATYAPEGTEIPTMPTEEPTEGTMEIEVVDDISALDDLNEEAMLETPVIDAKPEVTEQLPEEAELIPTESATIYSSLDDVDPDVLLDLTAGEVSSRKEEKKEKLQEIIPNPVEPIKMNLGASDDATPEKKPSNSKAFMNVLIALIIIAAIVGFIAYSKSGLKNKFESPLTINNYAVSSDEFSFMYHYILIENGVDVFAKDAQDMLNAPSEDPNYKTNRDYFLDITAKELQTTQLLYDDATRNGYKIEDTHYAMARAYVDWLNTKADELNVPLDTYIKGIFGSQVDEQCVVNTLAKKYFTEDYASDAKLVELQATPEQAAEAYQANKNAYDLVSYKLIRITYEQREDAFIATANLHAEQIVEAMGHDQSMFELVASEYFSGDAQDKLLEPDSTLIKDARFGDISHDEFRDWLFDTERVSGDTVIFADEDGFPIILCFVSRTQQSTPLRNVKIIEVSTRPADENGENEFTLGDAQSLSQSIYDYCTDLTKLQSVENYFTDEVLDGTIYVTASADTYPGKFADVLDNWIFDAKRKPGDKKIIENENGFYVVYFISESENPEWYDRVNSFIRMNNYQAFLNEISTEYSYEFNQSGLDQIYDVP